jgi:hypothetical protein
MARKLNGTISTIQTSSNNTAWDGHKIKIFGARNEIIAFQLIVEADKEGIDG